MICYIILFFCIFILVLFRCIYLGYKEYRRCISVLKIEDRIKEVENESSYVELSNISKWLVDAVISIEDHRFFSHGAIDIKSILRAFVYNLKTKRFAQGGSTITQQLCKNLIFSRNKTLKRKIAEMFAAVYLEKQYSKEKIIELYLNVIYFGNGYYGIREASYGYFGVAPKKLKLGQSTLLAGCIHAPSRYNLNNCSKKEKNRQRQVLISMIKYKK